LDPAGVERIITAALDILARTGIAECPDALAAQMVAAGATRRDDGRVCFPKTMVETAIARAAGRVSLPGFVEDKGLTVGGGHVHIGTGGAATEILDSATGAFRGAQLADLYDLMRLASGDRARHG
jgi:trimethylamine--corrinoid protein Co-methyltransferase